MRRTSSALRVTAYLSIGEEVGVGQHASQLVVMGLPTDGVPMCRICARRCHKPQTENFIDPNAEAMSWMETIELGQNVYGFVSA